MWCAIQMALTTLLISCRAIWGIWRQGPSVKLADFYLQTFAKSMLQISNTKVVIDGLEHFDHTQSYVFMSNHRSLMDIPVLNYAIPQSLRMVAKAELFRIPFFGEAMRKCGTIEVNRQNKQQAIAQLEQAKHSLRDGLSVWIAPEGTRSRTSELGPFKKGGFHIAMALGIPIVPVWLEGTQNVLSKHHTGARRHQTVHVYFGKPIETSGVDLDTLMKTVKAELFTLHL